MDKHTRAWESGTSSAPITAGRNSTHAPSPERREGGSEPQTQPGLLSDQPYCLARPWLSWITESLPDRKLAKLFHLFDLLARYLGACIGAEILRDGQLAYVVNWFKRPITVEEVHRINLTALRRARPSPACGLFTLLQELYLQKEVQEAFSELLAGRQRYKAAEGRMDRDAAGRLHAELSLRMETLVQRFAAVKRFTPLIIQGCLPAMGGGFEWRGLEARGPDPVFAPITLVADREIAPGSVVLRDPGGPLTPLDPWILSAPCPMCREHHMFLLKDILDPAALYISVEGECLISLPLSGQALLSRALAGGAAPGASGEPAAAPEAPRAPTVLGLRLSRTFRKRELGVRSLAWSPDGRWLAAGGGDGAVRVDEYESGQPMALLKHHSKPVTGLAWSPDQQCIATAGRDGALVVWETSCWRPVEIKEGAYLYPVTALAWSPSGVLMASAHEEGRVWVWEAGSWKMHAMLDGHGEGTRCLAWCGPRYLLTGASDGCVRMWDAYAKSLMWVGRGHTQGVTALAQSQDGRWLVSAGEDGLIFLWNAREGLPLASLEAGGTAIAALSASRDGQYLASRSVDGLLRIWDTSAWEVAAALREAPPDRGSVPIQFHPFLPLLASVDPADKSVKVLRVDPNPPGEITAWGTYGFDPGSGRRNPG